MNKPLIVCALEAETQGQLKEYDVLYTGVGKVNATIRLMERLSSIFLSREGALLPSVVINYGTAGSRRIEKKTLVIDELKDKIKDRTSHLKSKNSELGEILKETEKEEKTLLQKSKEFEKKIEDNLIAAYKRIRSNVRNGLAIVPIERNASGGSYFTIPPQVQMEIASRQKIITDEYSGRILVDPKLAEEEMDKMKSIFS